MKITEINDLHLTLFTQDQSPELMITKRPLIFIAPGGGYHFVSAREADPIAITFLGMGYNAAILRYTCAPEATYPVAYFEAFNAIKYIKENADALNVDADRIVVCGFSAGAHLAAMTATGTKDPEVLTHFNVNEDFFNISGMILAYPVITSGKYAHRGSFDNLLGNDKDSEEMLKKVSIENRVSADTPPAFIWHTCTDGAVPVQNSLLLANALSDNNIPYELHIYPMGGHGLSLGNELTASSGGKSQCDYVSGWVDQCKHWLNNTLGNIAGKVD